MTATQIKICGLTRVEDAVLAASLGAWAVGFVFHPASPRNASWEVAREVAEAIAPNVHRVGVFVDQDARSIALTAARARLTAIQCHGPIPNGVEVLGLSLILRVQEENAEASISRQPEAVLVDAPGVEGGTGKRADWNFAREISRHYRLLLAGGLKPDNVAKAIRQVRPWGVDVSSGIETKPGQKEASAMKFFFEKVREATA